MSLLDSIDFFKTLTPSERDNLALFCQERFLRSFETLFNEWDEATALYVVKSWKLKAYQNKPEWEVVLGYINAWEFVGEMAFFDWNITKKRMASIKSIEDTQLIVIMNSSMKELATKNKEVFDKIVNIIEDRKNKNNK